jgi:hypothetical protein
MAGRDSRFPEGAPRGRQVVLVVLLMLMGSCGVGNGITGLRSGATPPIEDTGDLHEATVELAEALGQVLQNAPMRRALAAANIVVSLLLPFAAATVLTRRSSMRWWVTQASLANAVWTGLDVGSQATALLRARDELLPLLEQELAQRRASDAGLADLDPQGTAPAVLYALVGLVVVGGLVRLGGYGVAIWLARRLHPPPPV